MRTKLATVLLSVAVHGSAMAWFAHDIEEERVPALWPRAHVGARPDVTAEPEVAPIEVAFVDVSAVSPGPSEVVTTHAAPTRVRISTGRTSSTTELPTRPEPPVAPDPPREPPKPPTGTLKMRTGPEVERLSTRLANEAIAQGGADEIYIPDLPGVRIDHELYKLDAQLNNPTWVANADPDTVRAARLARQGLREQRKQVELVEQKDGTYRSDRPGFVAHVDRDGKVTFNDRPNIQVHGLGGTFDVTDALMRWQGMDPYASDKLAYLDRTRDQRVEIAKVHRREQLAQAAVLMQHNLERVWSVLPDTEARKRAVFELWDECVETGDDREVTATAEARALLMRWVETRLRGADAFTRDELAVLNARRASRAVFAP